METIKVRITHSEFDSWYKVGDVIEVNNKVYYEKFFEPAFFRKHNNESQIILCSNCDVMPKVEVIPEYTINQLFDKIGHKFKIKS